MEGIVKCRIFKWQGPLYICQGAIGGLKLCDVCVGVGGGGELSSREGDRPLSVSLDGLFCLFLEGKHYFIIYHGRVLVEAAKTHRPVYLIFPYTALSWAGSLGSNVGYNGIVRFSSRSNMSVCQQFDHNYKST